ncbi:MAG: metalloregulator ArsR/SmtB family transcription factor [Bellilinea sp.]|jgi:DNA-binding transcriptional ArsR family regulator
MTIIQFDSGSAYDFFISLVVLHNPASFGLRPSWAAGVRSRLPASQREFLERSIPFLGAPLAWLHDLVDPPRNAAAALDALGQISPADRLARLTFTPETPARLRQALLETADSGQASPAARELLQAELGAKRHPPPPATLDHCLRAWSRPDSFGDELLHALRAYLAVYFAAEEARIQPVLLAGLENARRLAAEYPLTEVIETLSRGVSIEDLGSAGRLTLIPSYWSTPLIFFHQLAEKRALLVFGCRPAHLSLAGGGAVPPTLVETFKALGDPTRLRILRFLAQQPHTPAALAQRLRLRPPTVVHHLNILRLAGLVHISLHAGGERRYALRRGGVNDAFAALQPFLDTPEET